MSQLIEQNIKYYREMDVVMLETDKKISNGQKIGDLAYSKFYNSLTIMTEAKVLSHGDWVTQHLYFLSDEEIKEGDWCIMLDSFGNVFSAPQQYLGEEKGHFLNKGLRKIVATTDSLTLSNEEGIPNCYELPQPSPEFEKAYAEAYNRGEPITKVLVEYEYHENSALKYTGKDDGYYLKLKDNQIIIKKAEEKIYSESEVIELCKKVLDTFHSEGPTKSGKPRLARIKFNDWIKQNLK